MGVEEYCILCSCPLFHHSAAEFDEPTNVRELENYAVGGIFYWNLSMEVLSSREIRSLYAVDDEEFRREVSMIEGRCVFMCKMRNGLATIFPSSRSLFLRTPISLFGIRTY